MSLLTKIWQARVDMIRRCQPGYTHAHRYHARGISVCEEWLISKDSFVSWALSNGVSEGLTLDRRDNDKGYFPENCRWVTATENTRNRDNANMRRAITEAKRAQFKKPIRCIETGRIFNTQMEAHLDTGVSRHTLRDHLNGKYAQAGGFHWEYVKMEATQGDALSVNSYK